MTVSLPTPFARIPNRRAAVLASRWQRLLPPPSLGKPCELEKWPLATSQLVTGPGSAVGRTAFVVLSIPFDQWSCKALQLHAPFIIRVADFNPASNDVKGVDSEYLKRVSMLKKNRARSPGYIEFVAVALRQKIFLARAPRRVEKLFAARRLAA